MDISLERTDDLLKFEAIFGVIGIDGDSDDLVYTNNETVYKFPDGITKGKIIELYKKSIKKNKDYVLEFLKENGTKKTYKKNAKY